MGHRVFLGARQATSDVTIALTGQSATASAGALTHSLSFDLTGSVTTGSAGTLSYAASLALTGAEATASAGTLVYSAEESNLKGRKRVVRWRPWNPWKTGEKPFLIEDGNIKPVPAPPIAVEPITVDLAPIYERHDALTRRYLKALQEQEEELIAVLLIADDD